MMNVLTSPHNFLHKHYIIFRNVNYPGPWLKTDTTWHVHGINLLTMIPHFIHKNFIFFLSWFQIGIMNQFMLHQPGTCQNTRDAESENQPLHHRRPLQGASHQQSRRKADLCCHYRLHPYLVIQ